MHVNASVYLCHQTNTANIIKTTNRSYKEKYLFLI